MKLLNKLRITIIAIAPASTILGMLSGPTLLFVLGVVFIVATLITATIVLKYR